MEKVCCGGFYLGEGLELDGRTLKATGGSGLPDPSELPDGTALVAVNGEWKMQEGYGYTGDPAFEPIEWDGNTDGREVIVEGTYCRVADAIDVSNLVGAVFSYTEYGLTPTYTIKQSDIVEIPSVAGSYYISLFDDALEIVLLSETTELGTSGIYFQVGGVPMSLTAPASVHQFDSALIPTSGVDFVVKFTSDAETVEVDKTVEEIVAAFNNGANISCYLHLAGMMVLNSTHIVVSDGEVSAQFIRCTGEVLMVVDIGHDGSSWNIAVTNYTLTPAT